MAVSRALMAPVAAATSLIEPKVLVPTELMVTAICDSLVVVEPIWKLMFEKLPSSNFLPLNWVASKARVISLFSC